ncbi:MAG: L-threonylcarbamoyladenylate synthase [Chryseolinea sp.]
MAEIGKDISHARALLEGGDLVAIPTETVYGLAGNALDPDSVAKIFETKNRPHFDPLIIHVPDFDHVDKYVSQMPAKAILLAQKFWPGPMTMVMKKRSHVPDLVSAGLETIGIRCPDHDLTRELLRSLAFPLAAPSANPFGYVSPTTAQHVDDQLGQKIKYILDGGPCPIGIESTIVGFEGDNVVIYRMGGVTVEAIESIVGRVGIHTHSTSNPKAPGQLHSHYAPGKKILLGNISELVAAHRSEKIGIISFQKRYTKDFNIVLSKAGSLQEAAKSLFSALREVDKMPVDLVITELVPDHGLGRAINDRLKRASQIKL